VILLFGRQISEVERVAFKVKAPFLIFMIASTTVFALAAVPHTKAITVYSVDLTQSGVVTSDPLTTGNTALWTFDGSSVYYGTPHEQFEDKVGLHLGVQTIPGVAWAGYFAAKGENAQVFHSVLSLPSSTIPQAQNFNTGLYVQTGGVNVNYVTCAGGVNNQGYFWGVVEATGNPGGATAYKSLWFQWMGGQPLTRDCTIITNGSNLLTVYLDGVKVFSSDSMNLGYEYPLTAFLEVQTTDYSTMHFSAYSDYYATSSPSITVQNAPPGSTVEIVGSGGNVYSSGQVDSSGTSQLNIGMYDMPLNANINVYLFGVLVGSTSASVPIYGGDVYTVSLSPNIGIGQVGLGTVYTSNPTVTPIINPNAGQGVKLTFP
jgi:hypothetical protein